MSALQIRALDPDDTALVAAWHAAHREAAEYDEACPTAYAVEEVLASLRFPSSGERRLVVAGCEGDRVVATGSVSLPMQDNLDHAYLDLSVRPGERRRGLGSAVLEHLVGVARDAERGTLMVEAPWPYAGPADGVGHDGPEFLLRRGFVLGIADVKRALALPVDRRLLDELEESAAAHHVGYGFRTIVGPMPDELLEDFGRLAGSLNTEAPMGGLDLEDEVLDADRIRSEDRRLEAAGRTRFTTVALAPDGALAAYSDLVVPAHDPARAYQWGTLVRPDHRGHRLGVAVKVRNLGRVQQTVDVAGRLLVTYNAEVNTHMIGVNEALGFEPVGRLGEFVRRA